MKGLTLLGAISFLSLTALAQNQPVASPLSPADLFRPLVARELGPTTMGGRIHQLAVYENEPRIFYVGTASGGLWKTENGGITLNPIFQFEGSIALGAVAVSQSNPRTLWVGTGEENSRNSTSWGDGIYKSEDGGATWQNMGLKETKHVGKILLHPRDENTVYVGALGHLWGANANRGLYKTTDGGKTWNQILRVDDVTGVIDMQFDPKDPNTLLVAFYQRERKAYQFASGGPGSSLWKTTDGGKSFRRISKGLPTSPLGRIGLSVSRSNPNFWMATVEARSGGGVFLSRDKGETWTRANGLNPRPFYFSTPLIDPSDEKRLYVLGVEFHVSDDGGGTFRRLPMNIHVDHHEVWIDPKDSNHLLIGNDGGIAQSRDRGLTWEHLNMPRIGQFYAIALDMRKPYWVYGGLQDNQSWGGPTQGFRGGVGFWDWINLGGGDGFHVQVDPEDWRTVYYESQGGSAVRLNIATGESRFIQPRPPQGERYRWNWSTPIVLSPHNPRTVYIGGNRLFRSLDRGDNWRAISPDLTTNDPAKLQPRAGVTPEDTGAERHCTIVTISESPLRQGVIWVGTDDGLVWVTTDDGQTWKKVSESIPDLPPFTWCSRVVASRYDLNTAYATFDGHRNNDYNPYVYVTTDGGATWKKLSQGLPVDHCTYVIVEGRLNRDLLFLGTERGLYGSVDRGENWFRLQKNVGFPTVRVDDLVIHPRELDLVIGTHGRSLWTLNISGLEQYTGDNARKDFFLARPQVIYDIGRSQAIRDEGNRYWLAQNTQPGTALQYFLKAETKEKVVVRVVDTSGREIFNGTGSGNAGMNQLIFRPQRRLLIETRGDKDWTAELRVGEKVVATAPVRVEDVIP
ncbi:MAG: hypothetical protein MUC92_00580 [Fimbriimonadaceae bacterium]|jgi:photosystem II stability/assembly factor-like uncharacterized protein|nr:hypothetical protein [Fimbriimonadaceae bacterium]